MNVSTRGVVFGHIFCLEARNRRDLVTKIEGILGLMRRGALIIASQEAKGPDTHLPLQARWRIYVHVCI